MPDGWKFINFPEGGGVSGITADSRRRIYVAHRGPHSMMYSDSDGNFQVMIGEKEIQLSVYHNLTVTPAVAKSRRPWVHGLTVDAGDNVLVTDVGRHIVMKFSPQGKLLLTLGAPDHSGQGWNVFSQPTDVFFGPSGEIYVGDGYGNSRIVKFNLESLSAGVI